MRSQPSPPRSRTRGQRTATGPMPVMISRSGRCPWRTNRRRPSSVSLSAWQLSKLETSASTACARSARAPLRKTSVSGSVKVPGCESWKTLVSVTAYHSFAGEVEASNTPTIRRLTPSRRHQLSPIALAGLRRQHGLNGRDGLVQLFVRQARDGVSVFELHLLRHQQGANLQIGRRLSGRNADRHEKIWHNFRVL